MECPVVVEHGALAVGAVDKVCLYAGSGINQPAEAVEAGLRLSDVDLSKIKNQRRASTPYPSGQGVAPGKAA